MTGRPNSLKKELIKNILNPLNLDYANKNKVIYSITVDTKHADYFPKLSEKMTFLN